jgi:hypothetical protein
MLFCATRKRLTLKIIPNFKNLTRHAKKKRVHSPKATTMMFIIAWNNLI